MRKLNFASRELSWSSVFVVVLLSLVVTTVVVALVPESAAPREVSASGSYTYQSRINPKGLLDLNVVVATEFAAYRTENDARIDGWAANPSSAPTVEDRHVTITFTRPLSAAAVQTIATAADFDVSAYALVGEDTDGEPEFYYGVGVPDPSFIGSAVQEPTCASEPDSCKETTYEGVMYVEGAITADGVDNLLYLKNHDDVYLVDSTAIEVLAGLRFPSGTDVSEANVFLPSPYGELGW